jgi:hypothetical protein
VPTEFAVYFRRCQTIHGSSAAVSIGRRNGQRAIFLCPSWQDGGPEPRLSCPWIDDPRLYINLTDVERRTWYLILSGVSLSGIAHSDGVSRNAIYERIQGNRFGHGGMIGKNFWVLLWWRLRQRLAAGGCQ